jgi:hypothetical protein
MDPISNNMPPPYNPYEIDTWALQTLHRHRIEIQADVNLPKPFEILKDKKTKKSEKGQQKQSKNKEGEAQTGEQPTGEEPTSK